jgi:hypothetical protein
LVPGPGYDLREDTVQDRPRNRALAIRIDVLIVQLEKLGSILGENLRRRQPKDGDENCREATSAKVDHGLAQNWHA